MYLEFVTSKAVQIQNMASKFSKLVNAKVAIFCRNMVLPLYTLVKFMPGRWR